MSRFSPTVRPEPEPSFLAGVADAFRTGLSSYRETRDRVEEKRDRDRRRRREDDDDFMRGIGDAGVAQDAASGAAPTAPRSPNDGARRDRIDPWQDGTDEDPLAEAAAGTGVAEAASPSGVPGAFNPATGAFSAPRIAAQRLPSGRMWNPQGVLDRELAAGLQRDELETVAAERARTGGVTRRAGALSGLSGHESFKDVTPDLARALAETEDAYETFLDDRLKPRMPVRGTPEYEAMLRAEAAARAAGGESGRSGGRQEFSELAQQINDAQEELARVDRDKPEPKRTGFAMLDPSGQPLDAAAGAAFVADSTAQMRPWEERRARAQSVLDGLRAVRGDTARAAQGMPPQRGAEYTRERTAIDQRLQRILNHPRATDEMKQRAQAAYQRQMQELNSRYRDR